MTIIIDGIDVSECEFYDEEFCTLSNDRNERLPFCEKCTGYYDCIYKQLQRKTIECERLKSELELETGISYKNQNKLKIAMEALKDIVDFDPVMANYKAKQALEQIGEENGR